VCSSVLQRVADDDKQLVETAQVREGKTVGRVNSCVVVCSNVLQCMCCLRLICVLPLKHLLARSLPHIVS